MTAFPYSEKSACILTGYTRDMLRKMRNGCVQGKYKTDVSLISGVDYVIRYACEEEELTGKNGRVFYSAECVEKLKAKKCHQSPKSGQMPQYRPNTSAS